MKRALTLVIMMILFFLTAVGASAQEQIVRFQKKSMKISAALNLIERQTGLTFAYNKGHLDVNKTVDVPEGKNVMDALSEILAGTGTQAHLNGKVIVISTVGNELKTITLKGTVTDRAGEPLAGASIMLDGTLKGVLSDVDGSFVFPDLTCPASLRIDYLGFVSRTITISGSERQPLSISLEEDNRLLSESVVIGYGTQKKETLTGSITVRKMTEIENRPMTHASEALYSMPGLYINQSSSKPGADGATIRIRGVGTLSSSSPMILVDGIEYSLDEINPDDIETISVLKDASASIYGSKAANGVILITTKSAKKGAPVVRLKANFGVQSPTYVPDVVTDPILYMRMRNQAELNEGKLVTTYNDADILEYEEGMKHDKYIYPASDWYDLCYEHGFVQEYNASVSGGGDKVDYMIGLGYMRQKGVMVSNDDATRYSWNIKVNTQVTKRLKVGASILGNFRFNTEPIYGVSTTINIINRALPIFSTRLPDGRWLNTWLSTPGRNNPENPLLYLKEGRTTRQPHRLLGKIDLQYTLPWHLTYRATLGYLKSDNYSKNFKTAMYTYNPKTYEKKDFSPYVYVKDWDSNAYNTTFYNTLSYDNTFAKKHTLGVMLGYEHKYTNSAAFTAKKRDYFNNQLDALTPGTKMDEITGAVSEQILSSFFGRVTYNYKEKYLADFTARYDGSSKFAKGNRWAFFPAVSIGWRLDKENWMRNISWIDILKLRGSVGQMGNQAIGNYEYLMSVLASPSYNYSFGDTISGGAAIRDFVDDDISWETTTTYNAGLDFAVLGGRLNFTADFYKKRTEGILRDVKIPAQIGNLKGPKQNIGVVANDGMEYSIQWRDGYRDFRYSLGGNFCYNKNIVVDLNGQEYISTFNIIKEGEPISAWYLYQADGFYNSYEEIANSATVGSGVKPGYIRYKDLNGDGSIDDRDRAVSGNLTPSITYAFNFSVGWKGVELSAQFQGVADVCTYLSGNLAAPFWNGAGVLKEWTTDAWTEENHNSRLPILHTATGAPEMHNYKNTQWLYDASYLRCKQLQLSWTMPEKWMKVIKMKQIQLFVNGQNLFTFSPLKMFDPEIDLSSTNLIQYPSLKTYNFGFNITF